MMLFFKIIGKYNDADQTPKRKPRQSIPGPERVSVPSKLKQTS